MFKTVPPNRFTFILGVPRSGTTWLAKIFDSHPDVVYRHEPELSDAIWRARTRQPYPGAFDDRGAMRDYAYDLAANQSLKAAGSLPQFQKSYRGHVASCVHTGLVYAARGIDKILGGALQTHALRIPDLATRPRTSRIHVVIKSVSFQLRADLLAEALPGARFIAIVRSPYGQVASMLRGAALKKFRRPLSLELLAAASPAQRFGLTAERLAAMPPIEQYAWHWRIGNEMIQQQIAGLPAGRSVQYETLCADPLAQARYLLDFADLPWHAATGAFIARSVRPPAGRGYYQVFKDPADSQNRWRSELTPHQQAQIRQIVELPPPAS